MFQPYSYALNSHEQSFGIIIDKRDYFFNQRKIFKTRKNRFKSYPQQAIGVDDNSQANSYKLPPKWVDLYEDTKDNIQEIEKNVNDVQALISERTKMYFGNTQQIDNQIQKKFDNLTTEISKIDTSIKTIMYTNDVEDTQTKNNDLIKDNIIKSLGLQIQELQKKVSEQQTSYYNQLKKYHGQNKVQMTAAELDSEQRTQSTYRNDQQLQMQQYYNLDTQNYEEQYIENVAQERDEKIDKLLLSFRKVNELFKQMSRIVQEQGTIIDRIDYNIDQAYDRTKKANVQLKKAQQAQANTRVQNCIFFLFFLNAIALIILTCKWIF